MISAIIHLLNSLFRPGCESAQLGAVEQQARRAYLNVQQLLKYHGKVDHFSKHPELVRSVERETEFKNGSKLEILIGTPAGVNGPHPNKLGTDENELMDGDVFQESRNMSMSKNGIMAQDWITSTRKSAHGPMQQLLDENIEAIRAGADPPYDVYTWCIFESAAPVPNCQVANPGCDNPCPCDRVVKGSWDDGSPRRFSEVCAGRLARSRGFTDIKDIHKTFRNTNQEVYEAQQLCTKPDQSGLVFSQFDRARHGIQWYKPDPDNGPIYMSADFGSTNPAAVNWYQELKYDVRAHGRYQQMDEDPTELLTAGTRVCFDEIYIAEIGNEQLAKKIIDRENYWRTMYPKFYVTKRFADVQNKSGRIDWAARNPPLYTSTYGSRDIKMQILICRDLLRDNKVRVDINRCEMFCEEAEFYHYPKKLSNRMDDPEIPVDDFNHVMSNFRYCMMGLHAIDRRASKKSKRSTGATGASRHQSATAQRPRLPGAAGTGLPHGILTNPLTGRPLNVVNR